MGLNFNYDTKEAEASNYSAGLEYYEFIESTALSLSGEAFAIDGNKYIVVVDGNVKLVSYTDYLNLENQTTWTTETSGEVYTTVGTAKKYLKITANGATLVDEKDDATAFETTNSYSYILAKDEKGLSSYVNAELRAVESATNAIKEGTASSNLAMTTITGTAPTNAVKIDNFKKQYAYLTSYSDAALSADKKYFYDNEGATATANDKQTEKNYFWKLVGNEIVNENGNKLVIGDCSQFVVVKAKTSAEQLDNVFYLVSKSDNTKAVQNASGTLSIGEIANATPFVAEAGALISVNVKDFNEVTEGEFSVTYKYDETTATDNPLENVTAISITGSANFKYVTGTYFVVDAPADIDLYNAYTSTDLEYLNKLTFVVVDPVEKYSIDSSNKGLGAKFTTKKGADLVAVGDGKGKAGKYVTNNAAFKMEKSIVEDEKMQFSLAGSAYFNDNSDLKAVNNLIIGAVSAKGNVFVTTTQADTDWNQNTLAEMGSENVVTADKFLSTSDAKIFNIQFLSQKLATTTTAEAISKSEYLKYLTIAAKPNNTTANNSELTLAGSDYTDLSAANSQWIVTNMENDIVTFTNLENTGLSFSSKLVKTENDNEYRLASVTNTNNIQVIYQKDGAPTFETAAAGKIKQNMIVKLTPVTFSATAGYVSNELDNIGLTKLSFVVENNYTSVELFLNTVFNANGTVNKIELNKDKSTLYELVKVTGENSTIDNEVLYAYLKDGKVKNDDKKVKTTLNQFAVKIYGTENEDGEATYLKMNTSSPASYSFDKDKELSDAAKFIIKENVDDSYSLVPVSTNFAGSIKSSAVTFDLTDKGALESENIYAAHSAKFTVAADKLNESLEAKSQHVTFSSSNTYMAVGEEGKAIMAAATELKAEYTKEDLTFWVDTVNAEAYVPTFYISKGSKQFLFNAADSVNVVNEGTGSIEVNKDMLLSDETTPRAIFRAGELKDKNQTLATTINGAAKDLNEGNGIEAYQYTITLNDADVEGEYIVKSKSDNKYTYLYRLNGELGFTDLRSKALVLTVATAEAPTSNEAVTASEVKVVAQDGAVVVKNAAGKNVVVSTILGQVVANEVLTSDNATINVPAGIVVVAVEGESFKINVK